MNRKQTIDAMAQAFNDADEAGLPLEECWGAALDAVLPATHQWPTTEGGQPIFGEGSKYCPRSYMAGLAAQAPDGETDVENTKVAHHVMKAAWEEFKTTKLFPALRAHMPPATVLDSEGVLWGIFYDGFIRGQKHERQK